MMSVTNKRMMMTSYFVVMVLLFHCTLADYAQYERVDHKADQRSKAKQTFVIQVGTHPNSMNKCEGMFVCDSMSSPAECIDKHFVCDGKLNCANGADEKHCYGVICGKDKIVCNNKQSCARLCDGKVECSNGEDEAYCSNMCGGGKFQCADGTCLDVHQVCDGHVHCNGSDDEIGCSKRCTCRADQFLCADGRTCIARDALCNNIEECPGGDDESFCRDGCRCLPGEYLCEGGKNCIKKDQLCDSAILYAWKKYFHINFEALGISEFFIPASHCPANDDEDRHQCENYIFNPAPIK